MISIIHPSRGRPRQMLQTRKKWLERCDDLENLEYIFSFDTDDTTIPKAVNGLRLPNKTAIEAINNAAKKTRGDLLIVVSDDFDCPNHWDALLLREVEGREDFVVKTKDGIQKVLVTLPIMDRVYYERLGYIYHPEYLHMAADVELTAVAIMTGKLIYSDLMFEHLHYSTGKTPKDAINDKNDLTYLQGDEVLAEHKENNFNIENPVCSYDAIVWHPSN